MNAGTDQILNTDNTIQNASQEDALKIVVNSTAKASTVAALPIPLIDMAGVAYVQVKMIEKLAIHYNQNIDDQSRVIVTSVVTGILSGLCSEIVSALASNTQLEKIISESLVKASLAGFITTITGEVFIRHMHLGGNVNTVDTSSFIEYAKAQLQSDRLSINSISNVAMERAIFF